MSSKLLINVNDASSAVIPDTSAPDTGMFSVSHTDGASFNASMILPIIGIAVLVIAIVAGTVVAISRRKKVNRFTTHTNKHLVAKLTTLSIVVLLGALGVLNADKLTSMVNATDNSEEDTLTITASDIKIDVDLNDKAVFATGESIVTVSSATEAGYTLMAYVDSTTTDLTNETNKSSKSTIAMLDSTTLAALTNNTWGIATTKPTDQTQTVFTGLPTTQDTAVTLKATEEATTANDKSTFYYGTYITPDLDYGTYSGATITYIAIANYVDPCNPNATTIQEAKCLQDFAGPNRDQIVDSMAPERQYALIDKRDEKTYTIAKLYAYKMSDAREGAEPETTFQVWMTQNLDLDLDSNTTYTNKDTDLGYNPDTQQYETASWTPERSTYTTAGTWGLYNSSTDIPNGLYYPESYDPGDLYWNNRTGYNEWDEYYQTCEWDNFVANCSSVNPVSNFTSSTGIPQYHLGNYYNWNAAVATNDSTTLSMDRGVQLTENEEPIEQSICPTGWTLPRAGYGNDGFASLWYKYLGSSYGDVSMLRSAPLYFPASGVYDGIMESVGYDSVFWSSIIGSEYTAFEAYFYSNVYPGIYPSYENYRFRGMPVRCIARPVSTYWSPAANVDVQM